MKNISVIAVTYNRPESLKRLLLSLNRSFYEENVVDLIISIDKSKAERKIIEISEQFEWKYGNKIIRTFPQRQGLRQHILQCGDYTESYDAVIVFEDDIIAAENYYKYVSQALDFYESDDRIGGISLYSPHINQMATRPFTPINTDSDVFFIQYAQSWGQCWSKRMWSEFKKWYKDNDGDIKPENDIPIVLTRWANSSWLKYYMKFIIKTNKYFVYPYVSLSSNTSEKGEHNVSSSNMYQVSMLYGKHNYNFCTLDDGIKYDVFLENQGLAKYLDSNIVDSELCIDLYGIKSNNNNRRYILTRRNLNYTKMRSYGLRMRPHDANIIYGASGDDIHLYDTGNNNLLDLPKKTNILQDSMYYSLLSWKLLLTAGFYSFFEAVKYKVLMKIRKIMK